MSQQELVAFIEAANKAEQWVLERIDASGSFGAEVDDIAAYYKAPLFFHQSGHTIAAKNSLNFIIKNFLDDKWRFSSNHQFKTEESFLNTFPAYIDAWLATSAHLMCCFKVGFHTFAKLRSHYHPEQGGFLTSHPYGQGDSTMDVFTSAHLGLMSLFFGDLNKAKRAGNFLQRALAMQPDRNSGLYLRMGLDGRFITKFDAADAINYFINTREPNQHYFIVGYISAFLAKLATATDNEGYLTTAKAYLDFILKCDDSLFDSRLSNQVAWAAAVLAQITDDKKYRELALQLGEMIVRQQDPSGCWAAGESVYLQFDATMENSIWLRHIVAELA